MTTLSKASLMGAVLAVATAASASTTIDIRNTTYTVDTLEHYKAGPGMAYSALRYTSLTDGSRMFNAYVVTADTKAEGAMKLRVELGRDALPKTERISAIAKRKDSDNRQYLAGINADFFIVTKFANDMGRPHMMGWPNMGCVTDGMLVCANGPFDGANRYGHLIVGQTPDQIWCDVPKLSYIVKTPTNQTVTIQPINWDREENTIVLYNRGRGATTGTAAGGKEIAAVPVDGQTWGVNKTMRFKVTGAASTTGDMAIPADGLVLSAGKAMASKLDAYTDGAEFTVSTVLRLTEYSGTPKASAMTGGDVILLRRGEVTMEADRWINPRDTRYPRTMAGYSEDRSKIVFCVVDGKNTGGSTGVTYPEGAEMMLSYGCYDAVNFDGGGSSAMYLDKPGIVSMPSDGSERAVGNGLFMTIDAPADEEITEIRFKDWVVNLKNGDDYTPVIFGYNRYGRLVDTDVQGFSLSSPTELGSVTGSTLHATGSGTHALTATYGGHEAKVAVTVNGGAGVEPTIANDADLRLTVTDGIITATVPGIGEAAWTLYNAAGAVMCSGMAPGGSLLRIDGGTFPRGLYVATVTADGRTAAAKAAL